MKKTLFLAAIFFGFIGLVTGLAFIAQKDQPSQVLSSQTNSSLTTEHQEFDFGEIKMSGGNVRQVFKLKNDGNEDVIISKISTSCDCTSAVVIKKDGSRSQKFGMEGMGGNNLTSETIKPGEDFDVEVEFNPSAHGHEGVGLVKRLVYLETNSKEKSRTDLAITANVTM